jgi:hypothetical protein
MPLPPPLAQFPLPPPLAAFVMKYEKDLSQLKLFVKFLDEVVKKRPLVCLSATVDVTESNQKNLEDRLWKVLGFTMYPYAESAGK